MKTNGGAGGPPAISRPTDLEPHALHPTCTPKENGIYHTHPPPTHTDRQVSFPSEQLGILFAVRGDLTAVDVGEIVLSRQVTHLETLT